ncbi:MAG: hypothetical protein JF603_01615 [Acidobacteria bacterium]|nr:hypothetical protein [Acidobacteriota bacterium]
MRAILALVAVTGAAALSALILGEYQLTLFTAVAAGVGVGLALGEIALAVGRQRGAAPAAAVAVLAAASIVWAAWIDSGRGLEPIRGTAWVGVALAAVTAGARLRPVSVR